MDILKNYDPFEGKKCVIAEQELRHVMEINDIIIRGGQTSTISKHQQERTRMGILCGVDIIEIDRIKKSFDMLGDSFKKRIFTQKEVDYCEARKAARYKSYAARFAAKEAVSKAFGTGISKGLAWTDIEVLNDENGKPYVILSGRAERVLKELGGESVSLSISHSESYAIAYAVIQTT